VGKSVRKDVKADPSSVRTGNRVEEIKQFYLTSDREKASEFLKKYNVHYIIVGQLEKLYYPGFGLDKFSALNKDLWREVYRSENTVIYQVSLEG